MIAFACFFRLTRIPRAPFAFYIPTLRFFSRVRLSSGPQYRLLDFVCRNLANRGVLDQTIGLQGKQMATAGLRDPDPGRRLFGFQRPTALRSAQSSRYSAYRCAGVDRCCLMHSRFGILYLGQVYARAKLERRRYAKRRPRTDYTRAVRVGAPSNLHRSPDHVCRDRDRARACRRDHSDAIGVCDHLDQTALRGKTHAPEIPRPIRDVSTPRETPDTLRPLAASLCPGGAAAQAALEPSIVNRLRCIVITIIIELRTAPRSETGNGVNGKNDIEHVAIGNRAGRRQSS
jgi:hypothetical protein